MPAIELDEATTGAQLYSKIEYSISQYIAEALFEPDPMTKSVFSEAHGVLLALLIETRKAKGLTQVDLAERLQKPQSFVSNIERGERRVDIVEFVAIARALGADPQKLFRDVMRRLPGRISI